MFDDESELQEGHDKARLIRQRRVDDLKWLMDDMRGRRYVWSLLISTRFESRIAMFDTHGGRQNYLLGAYEVGRGQAQEIRDACPDEYLLMVRENSHKPEEVQQ